MARDEPVESEGELGDLSNRSVEVIAGVGLRVFQHHMQHRAGVRFRKKHQAY